MNIKYDPDADAMYIRITQNEVDYTKEIDDNTIVDLDKDGQIIGIELLFVKERIPEFLKDLENKKLIHA